MLLLHRYRQTPQGDLQIRSCNVLQAGLCLFVGTAGPVLVGLLLVAAGPRLARVGGQDLLTLAVVGLMVIVLSVTLLVYGEMRETLLLSRGRGIGRSSTTYLLGLRERSQTFPLAAPLRMELRRIRHRYYASTTLWLILEDGSAHALTPVTVPMALGSRRTTQWMQTLASYLELPVPDQVVDIAPSPDTVAATPPPTARPRPMTRKQRKRAEREARLHGVPAGRRPDRRPQGERLPVMIRVTFASLGAFLLMFGGSALLSVLRSLGSRRYVSWSPRSGGVVYTWAEQPFMFALIVTFILFAAPVMLFFAVHFLRSSLTGRMPR